MIKSGAPGWRLVLDAARRFLEAGTDFIYPPVCLICERSIEANPYLICASCYNQLPRLDVPVIQANTLHPDFDFSCVSVFEYQSDVQRLIHLFKYRGYHRLAHFFGSELAFLIKDQPVVKKVDVLVPVPIHPARWRERGYNQAEKIADVMGERLNCPLEPRALVRTRYTLPQASRDREERMRNVRGVFFAGQANLKGKHVGLVDDVLTTGMTACECARQLARCEIGQLTVFTPARTTRYS